MHGVSANHTHVTEMVKILKCFFCETKTSVPYKSRSDWVLLAAAYLGRLRKKTNFNDTCTILICVLSNCISGCTTFSGALHISDCSWVWKAQGLVIAATPEDTPFTTEVEFRDEGKPELLYRFILCSLPLYYWWHRRPQEIVAKLNHFSVVVSRN